MITKHNDGNNHPTLTLTINGKSHEWPKQYISGAEVRKLGGIPEGIEIFLAIKKPWDDELISDTANTNLARPGIEHFFTKHEQHHIVQIKINGKDYPIERGKHTVAEIKKLGKVPSDYVLFEIVDGKIGPPLEDNTILEIKGGEVFSSGPRGGTSS